MRAALSKFEGVLHVTELDARLCAKDVYIKATEWSLTTSGPTGRAAWIVSQFVWLVATRIG